ncbi:MAG: bioC [Gammaproteobacteria bacterium]|nr:bioC [Gammaproteobacteria bacterium]
MTSRFEQVASADYEAAAVLAREVGEQIVMRLDLVALKPSRIIEVGCGTGYCTQLLKKRYPTAELSATEDSLAMLDHAKMSAPSKIHWLCTSPDALPVGDHTVDLIVGNLILPWCIDLTKVLKEWQRVLRPEGLLMFSSFGPDTLCELAEQTLQLPHFLDMHHLGDALTHTGFADPVLDVDYFTLTYREQHLLQKELESTGFISRGQVISSLKKNKEGIIPLTYEIIYGHTWNPEKNQPAFTKESVVKFPLEYLRKHR